MFIFQRHAFTRKEFFMRTIYILTSLLILVTHASCARQSREDQRPITVSVAVERAFTKLQFTRPVDLQHAGDGSNRLFVVEQAGRILVFANDQLTASSAVFLDIKSRVKSTGNEEGLLGLAFHPDFKNNGYFFVDYTAPASGGNRVSQTTISRFKVKAGAPNEADTASELILMQIDQPYTNHNGGQIVFGPDGYLYIAMGDGGSGGDPQNNAQNKSSLLGKILRIDVNTQSGGKNYSIPSDNPLAGNTQGWKEEIWTWGMRNPWRFSYDAPSKRWWCGDVGQNKLEEIDILERGKNYGWRIMEGNSCYNPSSGCDTTGLVKPIVEYGRSLGASVTGGYVYRGARAQELTGSYIYADYVSGKIWALKYENGAVRENTEIVNSGLNIASFGVDQSNELYICAFDGKIYRFAATGAGSIRTGSRALDFGTRTTGEQASRSFTITNAGTAALRIDSLTFSGAAANEYRTTRSLPFSLSTSDSTSVDVSFTASTLGQRSAVLTIVSNDPSTPRLTIDLRANVIPTTGLGKNAQKDFTLFPNSPNPFNSLTEVRYSLARSARVSIDVWNTLGMRVAEIVSGLFEAGEHHLTYTSTLPAGVYFLRMVAGDYRSMRMMVVAR